MNAPNVRVLLRASIEDVEVLNICIFIAALTLDTPDNQRPFEDWYRESLEMEDFLDLIPKEVELYCNEYILFECVGVYSITGSMDYYGEYDEETDFNMSYWTVAIDEE